MRERTGGPPTAETIQDCYANVDVERLKVKATIRLGLFLLKAGYVSFRFESRATLVSGPSDLKRDPDRMGKWPESLRSLAVERKTQEQEIGQCHQ
jgi:hypothetical protein